MQPSKAAAAAAVAAAALLAAAGLAGAVDLPTLPSQPDPSVADEKLAELEVPPSDPAGSHDDAADEHRPADAGATDDGDTEELTTTDTGERPTDTHGYEVSSLATELDGGPEKGEAVSSLASTQGAEMRDTHAQNGGDAGQAGDDHGEAGAHGAPKGGPFGG